jgi:hypothetical protein
MRKKKAPDALVKSVTKFFPRGIAKPAIRALVTAGYQNLEQLRDVPPAEILKLHGVGPKAIRMIQVSLKYNLKFGTRDESNQVQ